MKYLICCNLTEESIKDLKYYENKNLNTYDSLRSKKYFYIPIINLNQEEYNKIKKSIAKHLEKLDAFRVQISNIKMDSNKNIYLLIEPKGFLSKIYRILEETLTEYKINSSYKLIKWECFYLNYMYTSKTNFDIKNISFPDHIRVNSIDLIKLNFKKFTIIDSIKLKNI